MSQTDWSWCGLRQQSRVQGEKRLCTTYASHSYIYNSTFILRIAGQGELGKFRSYDAVHSRVKMTESEREYEEYEGMRWAMEVAKRIWASTRRHMLLSHHILGNDWLSRIPTYILLFSLPALTFPHFHQCMVFIISSISPRSRASPNTMSTIMSAQADSTRSLVLVLVRDWV